jgi:hypothetical protein
MLGPKGQSGEYQHTLETRADWLRLVRDAKIVRLELQRRGSYRRLAISIIFTIAEILNLVTASRYGADLLSQYLIDI